jgi:hypothetical protein
MQSANILRHWSLWGTHAPPDPNANRFARSARSLSVSVQSLPTRALALLEPVPYCPIGSETRAALSTHASAVTIKESS